MLEHEFVVYVSNLCLFTADSPLTATFYRSDVHKSLQHGETTIVPTKTTLGYVPFSLALEHTFSGLKKRELKKTGPVLWGTLCASIPEHSSRSPS